MPKTMVKESWSWDHGKVPIQDFLFPFIKHAVLNSQTAHTKGCQENRCDIRERERETRMKNKVQDLEKIVRELSGSVGDVLKTQAKALRENKENSAKIARQLNDLKELSTPHTTNDTSAVPPKPTTNPRDDAKSTNQKAEDERKRKSGPSSPEKKQRGRADFEPRQRTSS